MQKWFICTLVVGLVAGVLCLLLKKGKTSDCTHQAVDKQIDVKNNTQEVNNPQNICAVEEMYQTKSESAQAMYERHAEACSIMKEAYSNIMEDFVNDFSEENDTIEKDDIKDVVIDNESATDIKEIDLISDELDNLSKKEC